MRSDRLSCEREVGSQVIALPDVSLIAVSSIAVASTVRALRASMTRIRFGEVLLLSDRCPVEGMAPGIEWRPIDPIRSRSQYSRFILQELADHVSKGHALCVQWDGFVINPDSWDPHFLDYDYIGAPWPHFSDGRNVGNGGFSLRSRRLLVACKSLPQRDVKDEDVFICRIHRERLEALGMRFAPEAVARRFAYERTSPSGSEFGFHGIFNMIANLARSDVLDLMRSLEPQVLASREHFELLRWALVRGRGKLALILLARLFRSTLMSRN